MTSPYGDREAFRPGRLVARPDGSQFIQGLRSTYLETVVPVVMPPEGRTNRLEGVSRRPKEGTMSNTLGRAAMEAQNTSAGVREVSRVLSPSGLRWLVTVKSLDDRQAIVSKLRSSAEGRGMANKVRDVLG